MASNAPSAPQRDTFRPALFIGLGSTGAKIVTRLKRLIEAEEDPWCSRFYRYLRITSEVEAEPGVDTNIDSSTLSDRKLSPGTVIESFQRSTDSKTKNNFKKWWHADPNDRGKVWVPSIET